MKRMHIDPIQLGATPCKDTPNCWLLSNTDKQEMTITCCGPDTETFVVAIRIGKLQPDAQAYQLAAALMLNREPNNLGGGAVAYDVDDDAFLYCKSIDTRTLNLPGISSQVTESFGTARTLRELMLHAQKDIGATPIPKGSSTTSTVNLLLARRKLS